MHIGFSKNLRNTTNINYIYSTTKYGYYKSILYIKNIKHNITNNLKILIVKMVKY
jgi:hypothetical protein